MEKLAAALDEALTSVEALGDPEQRLRATRELLAVIDGRRGRATRVRGLAIRDLRRRRWRWAEIAAVYQVSATRVQQMCEHG